MPRSSRMRASLAFHERQKPRRTSLHRRARRRARLALSADRGGRPLCSGRDGELSLLGADERGAGQGGGRCRASSWSCRRRRAASIRWCWPPPALAGVDEIYRIGGAQAIAALAYGTETIAPVAKIVGPGNAYVAAAKRRVFGIVGIDMIAGPSEVLILADAPLIRDWVAADLLAQAEHDAAAQSILITDSAELARRGRSSARAPARDLPRARHCRRELARFRRHHPRARSLEAALPLVDRLAPEHLEIMARVPRRSPTRSCNAGAIFFGAHTPEAIGDYVGGSNHVLPTARSARFSSGLGVLDFMKRTSLLKVRRRDRCRRSVPPRSRSARPRGLTAHARSVAIAARAPSAPP